MVFMKDLFENVYFERKKQLINKHHSKNKMYICLSLNCSSIDARHIAFGVYLNLSYDVASGSEITPCNKIYKPLVVYRFSGNIHNNDAYIMTKL